MIFKNMTLSQWNDVMHEWYLSMSLRYKSKQVKYGMFVCVCLCISLSLLLILARASVLQSVFQNILMLKNVIFFKTLCFLFFLCVFGIWTIKQKLPEIQFYLLGLVFNAQIQSWSNVFSKTFCEVISGQSKKVMISFFDFL